MDEAPALDDLPGYRRRFLVTPCPGWVRAELEDDYHCMSVTVRHAGGVATAIEPVMHRAPWTTCPGAEAKLRETFAGVALADFAARGEKPFNCTHLHDLATLAAAHADDAAPLVYDVLVADPIDGRRHAELRRDGETVAAWTLDGMTIVAPEELAGTDLFRLNRHIASLDPAGQEAVRVFRWGVIVAHGRMIPLAQQSDATKIPPNCFTFQPAMSVQARRVGVIRDFSDGSARPLDGRIVASTEDRGA
jgi:hypothetical protein